MALADFVKGRGRRSRQADDNGESGDSEYQGEHVGDEPQDAPEDVAAESAAGDDTQVSAAEATAGDAPKTKKEEKIQGMIERLRKQLEEKQGQLASVRERSAARASGTSVAKVKADAKPPENVAEMFPRHKYAGDIWAALQGAAVQDGERRLSKVSINRLTRDLSTNRTTIKGVIKAFEEGGLLVDTTPELNEAHTYEVRDPFANAAPQEVAASAD